MKRKFFFFDIDGTLTNKNPGGDILPSTYKTIKALQEQGHIVSIATGRSYLSAKDFAKKAKINHLVTDGGNGLVVDHQVIHIKPLDRDKSLKVIEECLEKNIGFCVMIDNTELLYSHNLRLYECYEEKPYFTLTVDPWLDYHKIPNFYKIFVGIGVEDENNLISLKETKLPYVRYHKGHIEIEPDDKYQGILDMLDYFGGDEEDVVVFAFTWLNVPIPKRPTHTPKNAKIFASHFHFVPIPFSM